MQYDTLAVNTIVKNKEGEVSSCDILFNPDLEVFNREYLKYTARVAERCENRDLTDSMVIGTSAIIDTEIDGAVGMNSGIYNNPFIIWGRCIEAACREKASSFHGFMKRQWSFTGAIAETFAEMKSSSRWRQWY